MKPKHILANNTKVVFAGSAAALVLAVNSFAATTVGVLNPTPGAQTIQDSPVNVGHASFVTQSEMSSLITVAFANNTGGVVNWDAAQGWVANASATSFNVDYGTSATNTLTIARDDGGGANLFGATTDGATPTTSGTQFLGFSGSGSPMTLTFSQGLTAWGITQLNRFASRDVTMIFTLADNTTVSYASQNQDPNSNNTGALNWYGFEATEANPLMKVTITANGFSRFDDMAFVAVPEPSSAALLGLVGFGAFIRRRR